MPHFVDVAVPVGARKTFAYSVPAGLREKIRVGARVIVPFARRVLTGIVVQGSNELPAGSFRVREIRQLIDIEPIVPADLVETALWVSSYYFAPPGEVLRGLFPSGTSVAGKERLGLGERVSRLVQGGLMPPGLNSLEEQILRLIARHGSMTAAELRTRAGARLSPDGIEAMVRAGLLTPEFSVSRARVSAKERLSIRLTAAGEALASGLPPAQCRLFDLLAADKASLHLLQDVLRSASASLDSARQLEKKGLVEIRATEVERLPAELAGREARKDVTLTADQTSVLEELRKLIHLHRPARCLLHGVTGSGKTEVYLRLVAEVLLLGGTVLFLVPEISLTPLLSRIALSHFPDKVALLHSGMQPGERFDQWTRICRGRAPVVVGTRSAVFAPLENLRLAILDEEQDSSYKQDETPCYHAREVAWHRIKKSAGLLLMGSATPSIETFHAARRSGEMHYLCLPNRVEARPLPEVDLVDMGVEFQRHGRKTVLSDTLRAELSARLSRGEQAILLLNRRGYSRSLICRSCGHVSRCPDCSVALTYHQENNRMICHYCALEQAVPVVCSDCGGEFIYFVGVGTEQLEELVRAAFPRARVARLDRDSTRRKGSMRRTLLDFAAQKLDVLVGTQMLAKGHDFPNVTLVGVVSADGGLAFPDFRAAERTFQLLTQVAGRAGRGEIPGRVVIQSFYPDHYALRFARRQDYSGFFAHEIEFRSDLSYPPFSKLVQFLVSDGLEKKAFQIAEKIAAALREALASGPAGQWRILGPAAAPLEKLRGQFRFQVLLRCVPSMDPVPSLRRAFEMLAKHKVALKKVQVDVDPLSML